MKTDEDMIDEELLHDLAGTNGPTMIRPLSEITARAHALRRRRRAGMVSAACVVAGLAVAASSLNLIGSDPATRRTAQPATQHSTPAAKDCMSGSDSALRPADISDILFLPPLSVTGPIAFGPKLSRDRPNCDPPSIQAGWYTTKGRRGERILMLSGPNSPNPYLDTGVTMGDAKPTTVDVNGAPGVLYYLSDSMEGRVFWTAEDGSQWQADFEGVSRAYGLKAVRSLVIDGDHLPARQAPTGFPRTQPHFTSGFAQGQNAGLSALFGTGNEDSGGWGITVHRTLRGTLKPWPGNQQRVDINGIAGEWSPEGVSDFTHEAMGILIWTLPNGSTAYINGTITKHKALLVARAMVPISPDDPRLTHPVKP